MSIKTSASGHYQVVKKSRDHTLLACANLPPKTFIFMHYSMSIVLKFQGASSNPKMKLESVITRSQVGELKTTGNPTKTRAQKQLP